MKAGMILKNRYYVLEEIGKGGQGSLYLARDMDLGIYRAVKEMPIQKKKEAKLLRLLSHPGLPGMVDYIERDEICYLVMDYIVGRNLKEISEAGEELSYDLLKNMMLRIYEIMEYLHQQVPAIVHGDIKPSNIMMTEQGHFFLVDFGSAAIPYEHSRNEVTGTYQYASEMQQNGYITIENDFYSLGKTIYELMGNKKAQYKIRYRDFYKIVLHCMNQHVLTENEIAYLRGGKIHRDHKQMLLSCLGIVAVVVGLFALGTSFFAEKKQEEQSFAKRLEQVTDYYVKSCEDGEVTELPARKLEEMLEESESIEERPKLIMLLAYQKEWEGNHNDAEAHYKQLLSDYPDYEEGYVEYGLFLLRRHRAEESEELLRRYFDKFRYDEHSAEKKEGLTERSAHREESLNAMVWRKRLQDA